MNSLNTSKSQVYLPGLNGIRAIAAVAVVISHITNMLNWFGLENRVNNEVYNYKFGEFGVTIFFTLSGFLITFLILKEKEAIGTVKIKDFYIRRILRIWPLYYLILIISIITILIFKINFLPKAIPYYIFLAANIPFILHEALPLLAHYWSLGVEEQFYLVFPTIAKLPNRKILKYSLLFILIYFGIKLLLYFMQKITGNQFVIYEAIMVLRFHIMSIGVVAAIFYYYKNEIFMAITTHKMAQILSWLCVLLLVINKFHISSVINHEFISIVTVCLIMGQITRSSFINLENKIFDFIGKISYGIYVIHMVLILYLSNFIGKLSGNVLNYILVYILVLACTIFFSWISYEFFEKKFLKMKEKYSIVKSRNIKNIQH